MDVRIEANYQAKPLGVTGFSMENEPWNVRSYVFLQSLAQFLSRESIVSGCCVKIVMRLPNLFL